MSSCSITRRMLRKSAGDATMSSELVPLSAVIFTSPAKSSALEPPLDLDEALLVLARRVVAPERPLARLCSVLAISSASAFSR